MARREITDADRAALERFAAALKESERRERDAKSKQRAAASERQELEAARAALAEAISAVRAAKGTSGAAAADAAWRAAKARVLELETGVAPSWAPTADVTTETAEDPLPPEPDVAVD